MSLTFGPKTRSGWTRAQPHTARTALLILLALVVSSSCTRTPTTGFGRRDSLLTDPSQGTTRIARLDAVDRRASAFTIVAHARRSTGGKTACGRVALYEPGLATPRWVLHGEASWTVLGRSLTVVGDLDGDRVEDLIVGAPGGGPDDEGPGKILCVSGRTGSELWRLDGPLARGRFGFSSALGPDIDQDGNSDLIVGAPTAGGPGECLAAIHFVSLTTRSILRTLPRPHIPDSHCGDFGSAVLGWPLAASPEDSRSGGFIVSDMNSDSIFVCKDLLSLELRRFLPEVGWFGFGAEIHRYLVDDVSAGTTPSLAIARENTMNEQVSLCTIDGEVVVALGENPRPTPIAFSAMCVLDDLDGDRWPEIALAYCGDMKVIRRVARRDPEAPAKVVMRSGKTGAELRVIDCGSVGGEFATGLGLVDDLDADGVRDLVIGFGERADSAGEIVSTGSGLVLRTLEW